MNKTKKNTSGCLWIFIFTIVGFFAWVFINLVVDMGVVLSAVAALVLSAILTSRWLGRPSIKSLITNSVIILVLMLTIRFMSQFFSETLTVITEENNFKKEEGVALSSIVEDNDTIPVYESHRIWRDNYGNKYAGDLIVRQQDFDRLRDVVDRWTYRRASGHFWGSLYDYLEQSDTPSLDLVMQTFRDIHQTKGLNQMEFAEMVVTCIQDIPYSFIFQEECLSADNYEPSIQRILEECPTCCMGNVTYGIQNPVSFLQNLKGDCDTRTVLIYSILKHFNYDVAILNSEFYRHSIIGVNLPVTGIHKMHYGKKYVVWETTAKYYEAGKLPANFHDITHWNVILTSK
ncbi:MAG: hypothetical protein AAF466_09075 [Bacteroidota bacterium]